MDYLTLIESIPEDIILDEDSDLPDDIKGLYIEQDSAKIILLNKKIETENERKCVLAEEIGHYYSTVGDITNQSILQNRKQEKQARKLAYESQLPLDEIIVAHERSASFDEVLDILAVTPEFYNEAMAHYNNKYGIYTTYKNYNIHFNPFKFSKI